MDRISSLIARADVLRRRIYSSIPFEDRLAALFVKLSLDTVETIGLAIGAEFLLRGVTGMPDPGPRWKPESRNPALTLPRGYLRDFGAKLYGAMMKKFRNPEVVEEGIQNYLAWATTSGEINKEHNNSRSQAESFVMAGVMRRCLDVIRRERKHNLDSLDDSGGPGRDEDREPLVLNVEDPRALKEFQHTMRPEVWAQWMKFLQHHLHEDIPEYMALSMQGYDDQEIIGDPRKGLPGMLTHYKSPASGPGTFLRWLDKIPEVSKKFFKGVGEGSHAPV
jgi:hypothetical protein